MGGRGTYDIESQSIPIENRKYITLDVIDGIKVIADYITKNGRTPVLSNTADTVYAVYSEKAGRIKHLFFYKKHILKYCIDIEGDKSHGHKMFIDEKTGVINRESHSKDNIFPLTKKQWSLVNKFSKWKK